jgi:hypothetical protein
MLKTVVGSPSPTTVTLSLDGKMDFTITYSGFWADGTPVDIWWVQDTIQEAETQSDLLS